jgi:hypothetical protein
LIVHQPVFPIKKQHITSVEYSFLHLSLSLSHPFSSPYFFLHLPSSILKHYTKQTKKSLYFPSLKIPLSNKKISSLKPPLIGKTKQAMAPRLWTCFGNKGSRGGEEGSNNNMTADITTTEDQTRSGPVVVEMFSSQGCATSPAAELVLSRLGRGDFQLEMPVVVLAFHVDYWDYMGWKDPYGSSQWTVRQKAYVESLGLDTLLTPQVVVQGLSHCLGNDDTALVDAINNAPRYPALNFQVCFIFLFCFISFINHYQC